MEERVFSGMGWTEDKAGRDGKSFKEDVSLEREQEGGDRPGEIIGIEYDWIVCAVF